MVQPSGGLRCPLLAAAEIWCCVQVVPPGRRCPSPGPGTSPSRRKTLPKNGLEAALSAQTCDLSEKVVFDCLEITTGFIHEFLSRMLLGVGLSMRETAMASNPLKLLPVGKFDVRLE